MSTPPPDDAPPQARHPDVPEKARENLGVLRRFQDSAKEDASATQLVIERASRFFGSPAYLVFVVAFAATWIAVDTWGRRHGWPHMEAPPYFWLQGLVSFNALLLTVAVLIRQARMSELAEHRAHLDLQINLLTEQKVSKILQLIGERTGAAAEGDIGELQQSVDAQALLEEIRKSDGGR